MPSEDCISLLCSRVYNKCFAAVRETGPNVRVNKCRQKVLIEKQRRFIMKRFFYIPLTVIILAGALATSVQAQSGSAQRIVASIPFTFNVGKTSLPAGKYTVTVLNPTSDRRILQIRSANGRSSAMIMTSGVIGSVSENSKLVFERDDDRYYFAQAQMAGDSTSLAAVRAKVAKTRLDTIAKKKSLVVITAE